MSRKKGELNNLDEYICKWCGESFRYSLSHYHHEKNCKMKKFKEVEVEERWKLRGMC